jgi:cell division protease FtsH
MLKVTFGGRLAEEIFCNDISSGAAMDIKQATEIAKRMVKEWGMNEQVGFVYYGDDDHRPSFFDIGQGREYSESTAELIDREIKRILDEAYHATKQLMLENREKTEAIARALMKYETITGEEVHALIRGESLERPSVGDLLDAEQRERKVGLARPVTAEPKASPNIGGGPLPQPG